MRLFRHLFARSAHRLFPQASLERIAQAIAANELRHRGELCFAVDAALPWAALRAGMTARDRAERVFAELRVWDTEENNGVLIHLLLADRRIEIVADRGLSMVSAEQWRGVCLAMEERLAAGEPEAAVLRGVVAAGDLLAAHFPRIEGVADRNELPDLPRILD